MTKVIAITIIMAYWFYASVPFVIEKGIQYVHIVPVYTGIIWFKRDLYNNNRKQMLAGMGDFNGQVYK